MVAGPAVVVTNDGRAGICKRLVLSRPVANGISGTVAVLMGNGDGTLQTAIQQTT